MTDITKASDRETTCQHLGLQGAGPPELSIGPGWSSGVELPLPAVTALLLSQMLPGSHCFSNYL